MSSRTRGIPPITFVTYYTELSKQGVERILQKFPLFRERHWESVLPYARDCIHLLFASARLSHPGCKNVILTDTATPLKAEKGVEMIRLDLDPDQPAYMRLAAQIHFIKNFVSGPMAFLDYDMLVQGSLLSLFDKRFDLAVSVRTTYQGKPHPCPINGGLLIVHPDGIESSVTFLKKVLAYYDAHYAEFKNWGGFQGAINDVVGDANIFGRTSDIIETAGTRLLILPEDIYNFTLGGEAHLVEYVPDKKILHFKGMRKDDMARYWNEYLRSRT